MKRFYRFFIPLQQEECGYFKRAEDGSGVW
jgi:hypothetical protein